MEPRSAPATSSPSRRPRPAEPFAIQQVHIDWARLIAKRPLVLDTVEAMPAYLLKPEVLALLAAEPHPAYRLILDLMWSTGARISEILALTPASFVDDGYDFGVILQTLKQGGAPRPKRYIPIPDTVLRDRIQSYLYVRRCGQNERVFPMARQTVNRHIHRLVATVGGAPISISAHTFRHAFAVHLVLHGRPLKIVSRLLGHQSIESTEIYTNVLTADGGHFLDGVDFH